MLERAILMVQMTSWIAMDFCQDFAIYGGLAGGFLGDLLPLGAWGYILLPFEVFATEKKWVDFTLTGPPPPPRGSLNEVPPPGSAFYENTTCQNSGRSTPVEVAFLVILSIPG